MCSFCHENCQCIILLPVNKFLYHPGVQQLTISSSSSSSSIPSRKYLADRAPYFSAGVKCRFVNLYFRQTSTKRLERKVVSHNSIISHNSTPHNTESPAAGLSNGCGNGPVFLLNSGPRGLGFESRHSDQMKKNAEISKGFRRFPFPWLRAWFLIDFRVTKRSNFV